MSAPELKDLHSAMVATLSGYKEAMTKSDDSSITALCKDMIELRSEHHRELHAMLEKHGEKADDGSTIMSKIQETVIDVRAAITGIDKDTLPSFIRGEESIVKKYDDALAESKEDTEVQSTLSIQKAMIATKIVEMKAMSPSS